MQYCINALLKNNNEIMQYCIINNDIALIMHLRALLQMPGCNHNIHHHTCNHHIRNPVNYTMMLRETRKIKCLNLFSP